MCSSDETDFIKLQKYHYRNGTRVKIVKLLNDNKPQLRKPQISQTFTL